jgi:hypothetical protein
VNRFLATAVLLSAASSCCVIAAPRAHALDMALNGKYQATSNGDWAQTDEVYRQEASVRSVWTISMSCVSATRCSGRVDSDAGWSSDIVTLSGLEYVVKLDRPNWEPCANGTTVTGHQRYHFYPAGPGGFYGPDSTTYAGWDKTTGEGAGCGRNDKLQIELPFRLEKLV